MKIIELDAEQIRKKFFSLSEPREVASLLEVEYGKLIYLIYKKDPSEIYRSFYLNKKSGGRRLIDTPIGPLKIIQRKLNDILQLIYKPKPSVHGFLLNRSIVSNAQAHVRKHVILNLDLKNFFPSINFGRVRGMFIGYPYNLPTRVATILAQLCCYDNRLPQGAPTSPIISNMICSKLDSALQGLAKKYRCTYTRYADDITFSTNAHRLPKSIVGINDEGNLEVGPELRKIISDNGFEVNETKTRTQGKTRRQEATGLTVNRSPNVTRRYIRNIRAMLHAWKKYGKENAENVHNSIYCHKQRNPVFSSKSFQKVVRGKIDFVRMVKGETDSVYRNLANKYYLLTEGKAKFFTKPIEEIFAGLWILEFDDPEDTNKYSQGTGFMLENFGLVTCNHVLRNGMVAFQANNPTKKFPVSIVVADKALDLAILMIDAKNSHYLNIGDNKLPEYHDKVTLAGFPNYNLGHTPYITPAQVVGFRKIFGIDMILINSSIVHGNSGGPLFDSKYRVIGVAASGVDSMDRVDRPDYNGVIPICYLKKLNRP